MTVTPQLLILDFAVVVALTTLIGFTAPRWPDRWLDQRAWHVPFLPWEDTTFYRRIGVSALSRRLPEAGSLFGGESKSALPGYTVEALRAYYVEVSRAEWVHLGSIASSLVLFAFNPPWLAALWFVFVSLVNLLFLAILRHNRLRITGILDRMGSGR